MENKNEFRPWDELIPDALGIIFCKLSLQEKLTVIPGVCKSWEIVANGPFCWKEIDLEEWSMRASPQDIDRMVRMLITRSSGSVQKLCASKIHSDTFAFIAENARALKTLQLHRSTMNDTTVEQIAPKLTSITWLDLSYCMELTAPGLESIGKHCKSLTSFIRNMHPIDSDSKISQGNEARAIATSMPNLKHLEIAYMLVDTNDVVQILDNCLSLEIFDIRGCWNVKLDDKLVAKKFQGVKIWGPHVVDEYYELSDTEDDDFSSVYDSDSLDGWDDENLEIEFYGEWYPREVADNLWPASP